MGDCPCDNFPSNLSVQGNLGIGTSSPTRKLHVVAPANSAAKFDFYNDPNLHLAFSESFGPQIDFSRTGSVSLRLRSSVDGQNFTERFVVESSGRIQMAVNGGNVGIGTPLPVNKLDVAGGAAIGYGGTALGPGDGLIVLGNVGIGVSAPSNKLDVEGAVAIGAAYSGASPAPPNGLIVEGNVGIGTAPVGGKLHVKTDQGASIVFLNDLTGHSSLSALTPTSQANIMDLYGSEFNLRAGSPPVTYKFKQAGGVNGLSQMVDINGNFLNHEMHCKEFSIWTGVGAGASKRVTVDASGAITINGRLAFNTSGHALYA